MMFPINYSMHSIQEKINSVIDIGDVRSILLETLLPMQAQLLQCQQTIQNQDQIIKAYSLKLKDMATQVSELCLSLDKVKSKVNLLSSQKNEDISAVGKDNDEEPWLFYCKSLMKTPDILKCLNIPEANAIEVNSSLWNMEVNI